VIIYEKSVTDRVYRIHQVIKAATPSWTFEGGICDAAWEALAILHHEEDNQMEHSQYWHFLSQAREGDDVVVLPMEDCDRIGCFADQVKLTRALVWDLDEVIKEIKQLGEHGQEASQKITKLEALCKQKEDAAKKLKEEKANLEGMIQSHDELIMKMANKYGLNHMGENDDDEDEDEEDDDDGGDTAAPPAAAPPPVAVPPTAAHEVIIIMEEENPVEMVPE
jgi:hypothetical protein